MFTTTPVNAAVYPAFTLRPLIDHPRIKFHLLRQNFNFLEKYLPGRIFSSFGLNLVFYFYFKPMVLRFTLIEHLPIYNNRIYLFRSCRAHRIYLFQSCTQGANLFSDFGAHLLRILFLLLDGLLNVGVRQCVQNGLKSICAD
jgi:hypothetical protein